MHQGMCHCHHAPTTQSPCSHRHGACCSARCANSTPSQTSSVFATPCPVLILPVPPSSPSINLVMTTWHGTASYGPRYFAQFFWTRDLDESQKNSSFTLLSQSPNPQCIEPATLSRIPLPPRTQ
ncbi:unnamed protein product [Pleuronectes platessa]|uniref:Uncharacterized protein n=1 Tax=Pleuronectes platessa TaxID=8262 RepID=A0A9N7TXI4_PLEPL|nr:unnamed protein product [Pleuronectes platessa]